jgi:hypothetical protein
MAHVSNDVVRNLSMNACIVNILTSNFKCKKTKYKDVPYLYRK